MLLCSDGVGEAVQVQAENFQLRQGRSQQSMLEFGLQGKRREACEMGVMCWSSDRCSEGRLLKILRPLAKSSPQQNQIAQTSFDH